MNVAKILFAGELTDRKRKIEKDKNSLFTDLFDALYKEIEERDKSLKKKTSTNYFTLKFKASFTLPDKAVNQTELKSPPVKSDRTEKTEKPLEQEGLKATSIFNKPSFNRPQSNLTPLAFSSPSKEKHFENSPVKPAKSNKTTPHFHLNVEPPAVSGDNNPYTADFTFFSMQHSKNKKPFLSIFLKKRILPETTPDSFLQTEKQQKTKKTEISPDNVQRLLQKGETAHGYESLIFHDNMQSLSGKNHTPDGKTVKPETAKTPEKIDHFRFSGESLSTKDTVNLPASQTPLQDNIKHLNGAQLEGNKLILKNNPVATKPSNSLPEDAEDTHTHQPLQKEIPLREKTVQTDISEKKYFSYGKDRRSDSLYKAVNTAGIQKEQIKQTDTSNQTLKSDKNSPVNRITGESQLKTSYHQTKVVDISEYKNSPVSVTQKDTASLKGGSALETEKKVKKILHKREKTLKKFTESLKTDFSYSKNRSEERESSLDANTEIDKRTLTDNIHLFNFQTEEKQSGRFLLDNHRAVEIPVENSSYQSGGDGSTESSPNHSTPEQHFDTADIRHTNKTVDFSVKIGDIGVKARYNGYKLNLIIMTDHQHAQMINSMKSEIVHIIEESGIQSYILRIKSKEKNYKISSGSDTPHKTVRSREINVRV